jgi:spermidine synthase
VHKVITESQYPERDAEIVSALEGATTAEVADRFHLSAGTVRKIARRAKGSKQYDLVITDGVQTVPVGQIITSRGFIHACKRAMREYSGFFSGLELPQWRLVAGSDSISLRDEALQA